ncbi:MAG TPA: hypothetical protein VGX68_20085 [Thermoanaerobaculia bacterium]|nr:hypothetical protein [Thermoanaerobaculia bacterium]
MKEHFLLALALALTFMSWLPLHPAEAEEPVTPASLVPCPYTPEEIEAALGVKVNPGEAADMEFPAGRDVGCLYQVVGGSTTIAVRQTWDPTGSISSPQSATKKGKPEPIPGDPDGASWNVGGGKDDEPQLELSYKRGKVQTRFLIHGRSFRETEMQPKVLKLKRVP